MIRDRDGTYRSLWVQDSEAVYDEHGSWSQRGADLFMPNSTENWANYHVFYQSQPSPSKIIDSIPSYGFLPPGWDHYAKASK